MPRFMVLLLLSLSPVLTSNPAASVGQRNSKLGHPKSQCLPNKLREQLAEVYPRTRHAS